MSTNREMNFMRNKPEYNSKIGMGPKLIASTAESMGGTRRGVSSDNSAQNRYPHMRASATNDGINGYNFLEEDKNLGGLITQTKEGRPLTTNIGGRIDINSPRVVQERNVHSVNPKQRNPLKFLPDKAKEFANKKTLILDLDETLVHSAFKPFKTNPDIVLKVDLYNKIHDILVLVRPGAIEFLERMSKFYEIVIFTASLSKYADPLIDKLDPRRHCQHRLFREHCTEINHSYIKDLSKVNRNLKDVIIVDNNPVSYALNFDNGLPIKSWYEDKNDQELYKICKFLEYLAGVDDVRNVIKNFVDNNEINFAKINKYLSGLNNENEAVLNNNNQSPLIEKVKIKEKERYSSNIFRESKEKDRDTAYLNSMQRSNMGINNIKPVDPRAKYAEEYRSYAQPQPEMPITLHSNQSQQIIGNISNIKPNTSSNIPGGDTGKNSSVTGRSYFGYNSSDSTTSGNTNMKANQSTTSTNANRPSTASSTNPQNINIKIIHHNVNNYMINGNNKENLNGVPIPSSTKPNKTSSSKEIEVNTFRRSSNNPITSAATDPINKPKRININPISPTYGPVKGMLGTQVESTRKAELIPKYSTLADKINMNYSNSRPLTANNKIMTNNSANLHNRELSLNSPNSTYGTPYTIKESKLIKENSSKSIGVKRDISLTKSSSTTGDKFNLNNISQYSSSTTNKPRVSSTRPSSDRYNIQNNNISSGHNNPSYSNKTTPKKAPKQISYIKDNNFSEMPKRSSSVTNKRPESGSGKGQTNVSSGGFYSNYLRNGEGSNENARYNAKGGSGSGPSTTKYASSSTGFKDKHINSTNTNSTRGYTPSSMLVSGDKTNRSYSTKNNRAPLNQPRINTPNYLSENKRIYTSNIQSTRTNNINTNNNTSSNYSNLLNNNTGAMGTSSYNYINNSSQQNSSSRFLFK